MDENQPKPNINNGKKSGMGERRASLGVMDKVLAKISEADSVLVALSNDPTVDEIAAAMGLSMALDTAGKHVTAIYSGKTPNVLEFLKPEERFETGTESLQDFVIALNKDKADHLRYKVDGDFVKVYVTPYKTTISGDDIEFSRGDYNVDLVISLNVPAATELDAALKEHGRIMHDATSVNITNGAAGKFGDVEWVEPNASSISEMVAKLAFELEGKMDEATATALLTGLVAATDRFSNPATTPEAMVLAAKLMGAGADQQLVVQNVQGEVVFNGGRAAASEGGEAGKAAEGSASEAGDKTSLDIDHSSKSEAAGGELTVERKAEPVEASEAVPTEEVQGVPDVVKAEVPVAAEALPSAAPEASSSPEDAVKAAMQEAMNPMGAPAAGSMTNTVAGVEVTAPVGSGGGYAGGNLADQILGNIEKGKSNVGATDYGKMIDEALNEPLPGEGGIQVGANGPNGPQVNTQDVEKAEVPMGNPAAALGAQMMAGAGQMGAEPVVPQPVDTGMTEEEAMNLIKQGQAEAEAALPGMPADGELPKIIPTGGGLGYESPAGSPMGGEAPMASEGAMPSASSMGSPMPMPGDEMAPPPVPPVPDFGAMPPSVPEMPSVPTMPAENVVPVPSAPEPVAMPDVTVQPDMGADLSAMSLPQVQENVVPAAAPVTEAPADPSAFKIPGIHT